MRQRRNLWGTPAKSGGKNHWIDPAYGEDLDRAAPFLLAYDPGDDGSGTIQCYRCEPPPDYVWDFIVILKAHTHGILDAKHPETLLAVWGLLKTAILRNNNMESMMWSKDPDAKFGFKVRNIFEMTKWNQNTSLRLQAEDDLLGITEVQLGSDMQAVGYDPSKIEGYDEKIIIPMYGWKIIKHFLLQLMDVADFKKLHDKVVDEGFADLLTRKRFKFLENAAAGHYETPSRKKKKQS